MVSAVLPLLLMAVFGEASTSTGQATCVFNSTTCSCREFQPQERGLCVTSTSTGDCLSGPFPASDVAWKCDCLYPTSLCERRTCTQWTTTTSGGCMKDKSAKCLNPSGLLPTIALSTDLALCVSSAGCGPNERCVLGMCRPSGICDEYMQRYCRAHGADMKCCDASSRCANVHLQRDVAMCSSTCGEECVEKGSVTCAFDRSSVGVAGMVRDGATEGGVWTVPVCGGITR